MERAVRVRVGQGRADGEEVVLDLPRAGVGRGVEPLGTRDRRARRSARRPSRTPRSGGRPCRTRPAAEQAGRAVVAGLRVNLHVPTTSSTRVAAIGGPIARPYTMRARSRDRRGRHDPIRPRGVPTHAQPPDPGRRSWPPAPPATPAETAAEAKHLKNIRQVTSGFAKAGEGYFRPDGKAIIFQAAQPGEDDYQIYTLDLAPGAKPVLVSTGQGQVHVQLLPPRRQVDPLRLDPPRPRPREGGTPDPKAAKGPAYSRSERYRWDFDPAMDIFRADPDGSNLVRLTDAPGYDAEGSYSPDGKQIIFTSFRDGDAEIYIMDADGKNPRRITDKPRGTTAARSSRPTASRSSTGATARRTTCSSSTSTTPRGPPSGPDRQRGRQLGAVLPPRQPPHRLLDQPHGHQNYEIYLMDTETGDAGADHLPRRLRRPPRLQPRRQAG